MEEDIIASAESALIWWGLGIGALLGALIQRTGFCMANCFTSIWIFGSFLQFKAYMVALLVAMTGVQIMASSGLLTPADSIFLPTTFPIIGYIFGGFIFGVGIVYAGGCATRILVRTGEGNLGALVSVLAFNISAGSVLGGHLAYTNVHFFRAYTIDLTDSSIPGMLGITPWIVIALFAITLAVLFFIKRHDDSFVGVKWPLTGVAIGLLVTAGWYATASTGQRVLADEFLAMDSQVVSRFRPTSLTFAAPTAEFFGWLRTASGSTLTFSVATVMGVVAGALIAALITRSFHWVTPPNPRAFLGHLVGGLLMGYGAILSVGCNIGQGLTGASVMGLGALLTVTFIILGAWTGVWLKEKGI